MIRIFIVHEQRLLADVIAVALRAVSDIEVVGYVCTIDEALPAFHQGACDVILASVTLPDDGTVTLTQTVLENNPKVKVVLTGLINSPTLIVHYFEQGATGYVLAEDSWSALVQKLRTATRDECELSPALTPVLMARLCKLKQTVNELHRLQAMDPATLYASLSEREREVLVLIEQGCSNRQIGANLCIEVGTVEQHLHHLLSKLRVSTRYQAAILARQALVLG